MRLLHYQVVYENNELCKKIIDIDTKFCQLLETTTLAHAVTYINPSWVFFPCLHFVYFLIIGKQTIGKRKECGNQSHHLISLWMDNTFEDYFPTKL